MKEFEPERSRGLVDGVIWGDVCCQAVSRCLRFECSGLGEGRDASSASPDKITGLVRAELSAGTTRHLRESVEEFHKIEVSSVSNKGLFVSYSEKSLIKLEIVYLLASSKIIKWPKPHAGIDSRSSNINCSTQEDPTKPGS